MNYAKANYLRTLPGYLVRVAMGFPVLCFLIITVTSQATENVSYVPAELPFEAPTSKARLNDKNQIAFFEGDELKLYLPTPDYGLPAGVNSLGTYPSITLVAMNNNGSILGERPGGAGGQSRGFLWKDGEVIHFDAVFVLGINDSDQILIFREYDVPEDIYPKGSSSILAPDGTYTDAFSILPPGPADVKSSGYFFEDINNAGSLVGRFSWVPGNFQKSRGVIWNSATGAGIRLFPETSLTFGRLINERNQVFGAGLSPSGVLVHVIYLPEPDYGLPAGYSELPGLWDFAPPGAGYNGFRFTDHGEIFWGSMLRHIWYRGKVIEPSRQLVPGVGSNFTFIHDVNNRGVIIGKGAYNGVPDRFLIYRPALSAEVTVEPKQVEIGEEFKLKVSIRNESDEYFVLTGVLAESFQIMGTAVGGLEQLNNPPPANALAPGETFTQVYPWRSSKVGTIQFSLQGAGYLSDSTKYVSPVLESDKVSIRIKGDLQIKRASQIAALFGINDAYQKSPLGQQRETIAVPESTAATFDIKVENDSKIPTTFFLQAEEDPDDQWDTDYLRDGVSIKSAMLSGNGYTTGELEPGTSIVVQAVYTPETAEPGGQKNVLFRLLDEGQNAVDTLEATARRVNLEVSASMHKLATNGLDSASIEAGKGDIDAPLIPVTDTSLLEVQLELRDGLVADGVTPLLFIFSARPDDLKEFDGGYELDLDAVIEGGGEVRNASLNNRLKILDRGVWTDGNRITLTESDPKAFAYLTPLAADDLDIAATHRELSVSLEVIEAESGIKLEPIEFRLRKPPIILIHGYNTNGIWGDDFLSALHSRRPSEGVDFVRTGRYGLEILSNFVQNAANPAYLNTLLRLDELAPMASTQAFDREMDSIRHTWAVTRHDVIAHSQGGLLTRMLCTENPPPWLGIRPFQSERDFYRGRFHRIVTVGSPQNGTRILYYIRALNERGYFAGKIPRNYPVGIASLMILLDVAQNKFDPFDEQIRDINRPDTQWKTDPDAMFHIIRTTVNGGNAPFLVSSLSDFFLGLDEVGGSLVIPRGSDGVVDWDSMGCHGPSQATPVNVYTISGLNISHALPILFAGSAGQVESRDVAMHALGALDQTLQFSAHQRFSSFPRPPLLPESEKANIDVWVNAVSFGSGAVISAETPSAVHRSNSYALLESGPATQRLTLTPVPGTVPSGLVNWLVEVYGEEGISYGRLEVEPDLSDPFSGSITIPEDLLGDVVVYAAYSTQDNEIVTAPPLLVWSKPPVGAAIVDFSLRPQNVAIPIGSKLIPQAFATYDNGMTMQVFLTSDNLYTEVSDPDVLEINEGLLWEAIAPGSVAISGNYQGINFSNNLTVVSSDNSVLSLWAQPAANGRIAIAWQSVLDDWVLLKSVDLENWEIVTEDIEQGAGLNFHLHDQFTPQVFYRLEPEGN